MKRYFLFLLIAAFSTTNRSYAQATLQVKTANGTLEGYLQPDGVYTFKGVPFAAPPVGELRWKVPQPLKNWTGVRKADHFAARPMQLIVYTDIITRAAGMSEDCLYLNIWTPTKNNTDHLPVLVYFYGGGFNAGDSSEPRYDGESMAKKGIVTVTVNYRLGAFGFLAHPELTKESGKQSSGNYGLMDQSAALKWVQKNIAAFGGDPEKVTIAGESAGSASVCAQMASPLSKGLFRGAIGESGSTLGTLAPTPLAKDEQNGLTFAANAGVASLKDLRALSAQQILDAAAKPGTHFWPIIDGYFFPKSPTDIYATGLQADIPLLAGWNSAEVGYGNLLGRLEPTVENYEAAVRKAYPEHADEVLKAYAATPENVKQVATDLAADRFIAYGTWKWIDLHGKTNGKPVYRYIFNRPRPVKEGEPAPMGASHATEIEFALGNLSLNKVYAWNADDYKVSEIMENYFANFIKTGNPNGDGLPVWYGLQSSKPKVQVIDVNTHFEYEKNLRRYQLLDTFYYK